MGLKRLIFAVEKLGTANQKLAAVEKWRLLETTQAQS